MNTLLLEPFAGIAGDMAVGALLDLGVPLDWLRGALGKLPLDGYEVASEQVFRGAFAGRKFTVRADEGHPHRHLADVRAILEAGEMPPRALARATAAFARLAAAEARAHGSEPEEIHFHEVGAVDSILDVAGAALGLEYLSVGEVFVTRIRVGTGEVECRHGRIPVPAPGTVALLQGLPVLYAEGEGETTTPTGAALLAAWAAPMPAEFRFVPSRSGYGAGTREDTALPNLLRATLGRRGEKGRADSVVELSANLDDTSPETIAFAVERLLAAGALDAWATPATMKKGRPGVVLTALAGEAEVAAIERVFFLETPTLGVRRRRADRTVLPREVVTVETEFGPVRVKLGRLDGEETVRAPEFEDCARIARERGIPLRRVYEAVLRSQAG